MPTKSHDTLAEFFSSAEFHMQLYQNGPFTPTEHLCIKPWLSNVSLPGSSRGTHAGSNTVLGCREKIADYALVYVPQGDNERLPIFPHVVMEVGFSQEYNANTRSVLAGVQEWLVATRGGVKLAVLFKIEEGNVVGKRIEQLEGIEEVNGDEQEVVEVEVEGRDMQEQCDASSETEDYFRTMDNMSNDADNWIGKFTVFMETWVYDSTTDGASLKQQRQVWPTFPVSPPYIPPCLASMLNFHKILVLDEK